MKQQTLFGILVRIIACFAAVFLASPAALASRSQVKIEFRVTGQKFRNSLNIPSLEAKATDRLTRVLNQQVLFLAFSPEQGEIILHFRLSTRGEEGVSTGDPRETGLFISLDGPSVEAGGRDYWRYREASQHGDLIGTEDDVVEKIAMCAQSSANFERLVRNVLSHIVLGTGGVLKVTPELQWIFPFGPSEMCIALNDTTFKIIHQGTIQNVQQEPRAFVVATGTYVPGSDPGDAALRDHLVGEVLIPPDLDSATRGKIEHEIERIKSAAPGSLRVKAIFIYIYPRPLDNNLCGQTFAPGTRNIGQERGPTQ